jgi:hypothetical protein
MNERDNEKEVEQDRKGSGKPSRDFGVDSSLRELRGHESAD